MEREVDAYLRRKFEAAIKEVEVVRMEDLELKNHLSGLQRTLLKARAQALNPNRNPSPQANLCLSTMLLGGGSLTGPGQR